MVLDRRPRGAMLAPDELLAMAFSLASTARLRSLTDPSLSTLGARRRSRVLEPSLLTRTRVLSSLSLAAGAAAAAAAAATGVASAPGAGMVSPLPSVFAVAPAASVFLVRCWSNLARFSPSFAFLASELPAPPAVSSTLSRRPASGSLCSLSALRKALTLWNSTKAKRLVAPEDLLLLLSPPDDADDEALALGVRSLTMGFSSTSSACQMLVRARSRLKRGRTFLSKVRHELFLRHRVRDVACEDSDRSTPGSSRC